MKPIPSDAGQFFVYLDGYKDNDLVGTLISPFAAKPVDFCGTLGFVFTLDALFARLRYPQPFFTYRGFIGKRPPISGEPGYARYFESAFLNKKRGAAATFRVRIKCLQNATWQGEAIWIEREKRRVFISALELVFLLDGALSCPGPRCVWGREDCEQP